MSDLNSVGLHAEIAAGIIDDGEVNKVKADVAKMKEDISDLEVKALPTNNGETGMQFLARVDVYDLLTDDNGDQLVDDAGNQLFAPKYDNISTRVEALEKGAKIITFTMGSSITEEEWTAMGYTIEDLAKSFVESKIYATDSRTITRVLSAILTSNKTLSLETLVLPISLPILYADFIKALNELKKG
nr:MAG TPA: hypothetical protein [Caudoviricetes sp.]